MSSKKVDLKVVFLGDSGVGKTCLLNRFLHGSFGNTTATIGASFATKDVSFEQKKFSLGLWDTAGQERYDSLSSFYCRGAGCAIICFDITNPNTFKNVQKWVSKLRSSQPDKDCFVILVGTKIDAVKDDKVTRGVEVDVAKKLAEKIEASCYYETSSKTGENIDNLFNDIVKNIVKLGGGESEKKHESVTIKDSKDTQTPASGSCC